MQRAIICLLVAAAVVGCTGPKTERDIIALLEGQGLAVVQRISNEENMYHWERRINLALDGEEGYSAIRFKAVPQADEYCRGQRNGVVIGYWCVSTWRDGRGPVWPKVKALGAR